jgi:hypothetical protein
MLIQSGDSLHMLAIDERREALHQIAGRTPQAGE